jgi:hypothetical protein
LLTAASFKNAPQNHAMATKKLAMCKKPTGLAKGFPQHFQFPKLLPKVVDMAC